MYFRGGRTIKDLLMVPKYKDPITEKSRVIYRYKCNRLEYDEEYFGKIIKNIWGGVQRTSEAPFHKI